MIGNYSSIIDSHEFSFFKLTFLKQLMLMYSGSLPVLWTCKS